MKTVDFCGTATVRSATSPGLGLVVVIVLIALCLVIGSSGESATTTSPERAQAAQVQPSPAPVVVPDPTPWWGPWIFVLLGISVVSLVVLVIARLNHSAKVRAAELGYGHTALAVPTRRLPSGRNGRPLALGPGRPSVHDPAAQRTDGETVDL